MHLQFLGVGGGGSHFCQKIGLDPRLGSGPLFKGDYLFLGDFPSGRDEAGAWLPFWKLVTNFYPVFLYFHPPSLCWTQPLQNPGSVPGIIPYSSKNLLKSCRYWRKWPKIVLPPPPSEGSAPSMITSWIHPC